MSISRKKTLIDDPLNLDVWMCYDRYLNHKINRLYERCLRIIYSSKKSSFDELLDKDKSVYIHHQNIKKLVPKCSKLFKVKTLKLWMKFFVSGMRSLMNFGKYRVFISLQLILFAAVQKVYDFSVRK